MATMLVILKEYIFSQTSGCKLKLCMEAQICKNVDINTTNFAAIMTILKGALTWYGELTWQSAHARNFIILCLLIG